MWGELIGPCHTRARSLLLSAQMKTPSGVLFIFLTQATVRHVVSEKATKADQITGAGFPGTPEESSA